MVAISCFWPLILFLPPQPQLAQWHVQDGHCEQLIQIETSVLHPQLNYKTVLISRLVTVRQVVEMMVERHALRPQDKNPQDFLLTEVWPLIPLPLTTTKERFSVVKTRERHTVYMFMPILTVIHCVAQTGSTVYTVLAACCDNTPCSLTAALAFGIPLKSH